MHISLHTYGFSFSHSPHLPPSHPHTHTFLSSPLQTVDPHVLCRTHIIIGTPGTVLDLLKKKVINPTMLVVDETDIMIDQQGHPDQIIRVQK